MASVWKRLQRVNKRAAKFQFTVSYNELVVETTSKWYVILFKVINLVLIKFLFAGNHHHYQ